MQRLVFIRPSTVSCFYTKCTAQARAHARFAPKLIVFFASICWIWATEQWFSSAWVQKLGTALDFNNDRAYSSKVLSFILKDFENASSRLNP